MRGPRSVTNAYGEKRAILKRWPDGSISCPFCSGPVPGRGTECGNPACEANPSVPLAVLDSNRAIYAARDAEQAERERIGRVRNMSRKIPQTA